MESAPQDVLDRLTGAIDDWDARWEACHQQIMEVLSSAQEQFERQVDDTSGDAISEARAVEEAQWRERLAEYENRVAIAEARNAELESQVAGLRETLDALLLERVQDVKTAPATPLEVPPEDEAAQDAPLAVEASTAPETTEAEDVSETSSPDYAAAATVMNGLAAPHAFFDIPAFDEKGHKRRIGDILVDLGVVTRKQLKDMLSEQSRDPQRRLGALAVAHGYTDEELVARILAAQLQLPFIRLSEAEIDTAALNSVPPQIARSRKCVPLSVDGDCLHIAMANPLDLIAVEDIEISTRLRVEPVVAMPGEIEAALRAFYGTH